MSQPPPSYPVPPGPPAGRAPVPAKHRPSGWWFVVGAGLVVAALAAGIGLFVWTLSAFFSTDATVAADGQTHRVSVDTDGDRMLWRSAIILDPACTIVDVANDQQVDLRRVTAQITKDTGGGDWIASYRFDPGSGELDVTCSGEAGLENGSDWEMGWGDDEPRVQIGPAPSIGGFVGGIIATIAVPALLGLFGVATLLVTGILWSTRPARPKG